MYRASERSCLDRQLLKHDDDSSRSHVLPDLFESVADVRAVLI